jgi:hypothetical protein
MAKKLSYHLRLEPDLYEDIRDAAEKEERTIQDMIRRLLRTGLIVREAKRRKK